MLEAMAWYERRLVVGLFDNDAAGATQHNSLRNSGFSAGLNPLVHPHRSGAIRAIILPTPSGRQRFVPSDISRRVLELEHFYTDRVLNEYGVADDTLYGSTVFPIKRTAKVRFAESAPTLATSEFEQFRPLFQLLAVETGCVLPTGTQSEADAALEIPSIQSNPTSPTQE